MAIFTWRGDAQAVPQVSHATPENVQIGDTFTLTINGKDITVTATAATVANVIGLFVIEINTVTTIPEWTDITASDGTTHLILTGPDTGEPFTVTGSAADGGNFTVTVAETVAGVATANEIQQVSLADGVSGGTFTLTYDGVTSGTIAYDAAAATVETALEAMSNIGVGDATVSGTGPWDIEFTGANATVNVPMMVGDGSSLTGTHTIAATEITQGRTGQNAIWTITPTDTTFSFYVWAPNTGDQVTYRLYSGSLNATDSAATVEAAVEALSCVGAGNVTVSKSAGGVFTLEFIGALATVPVTVDNSGVSAWSTIAESQTADTTVVAEVQDVAVPIATGGTFTLTFEGQTTSALAYNASAATVEAALEVLSTIGASNCTVTESSTTATTTYRVTFAADETGIDQPLITGSGASLTGAQVFVAVTQSAQVPVDEIQTLTMDSGASGGTFTITYSGQTTSALAYNVSAAAMETALELLSNIDAVGVTGAAGGPWTVTFGGSLAGTDVDLMTTNASSVTGGGTQDLTVSASTAASGPAFWDNVENWDQGSLPVDGSTIVFEHSDRDCLYGLDQSSITPASIIIRSSYTGRIGLPPDNGSYVEYRDQYLALGNSGDAQAIAVTIGEGSGSGSPRIKLNTGDAQTTIIVQNTGTAESDVPALLWVGTAATNVVRVYKGDVGIAVYAGEEAVIEDLDIGYRTDREGDAEVFCGLDVDVDDIRQTGGSLTIGGVSADAIETFVQTAGTSTINGSDGIDSLTIQGGACYYNSTGTLGGAPIVSGDGVLDFSQDMQAKTVTNPIEVHGNDAEVIDPFQVVTGLIVDLNQTTRISNLGTNVRITRGTPA